MAKIALSDDTITLYNKRVEMLTRAAQNDMPENHEPDTRDLVNHLIKSRHNWRSQTFGAYRSALLYWVSQLKEQYPEDPRIKESFKILKDSMRTHDPEAVRSNYKPSEKKISSRDLERLLAKLKGIPARSEKAWGEKSAAWLESGLATGLRPVEWASAQWADAEKTTLAVKTAKTKKLEGAMYRIKKANDAGLNVSSVHEIPSDFPEEPMEQSIRIVPVPMDHRLVVQIHMDNIRTYLQENPDRIFSGYHALAKKVIYETCLLIWGGEKSISLKTMRSQFAANAKKSKTLDEVQAIMGHSNPRTTQRWYGKKKNGHRTGRFAMVQTNRSDQGAHGEAQTDDNPAKEPSSAGHTAK